MMATKHLWEINHPYYCVDSNYYHAKELEKYDSWESFKGYYADPDLNLLFRFDWIQYANGLNTLALFFVLQRKGIFRPVEVQVQDDDEEDIKKWLSVRFNKMIDLWEGVV